jgi:hypothetical protein
VKLAQQCDFLFKEKRQTFYTAMTTQGTFTPKFFVEMLALPMIHTAWITALAGSLAHAQVLSKPLVAEDQVPLANSDYRAAMDQRPCFLARLF